MTYFLDTNVIIDLLNGNTNILKNFKIAYQTGIVQIPDIVYYEVLRGLCWKAPKKQLANFEVFTKTCGIKYMDLQTLRIAANQWATLKKNGTPLDDDGDILIGSLAIQHNAILVTNNTKHLSKLQGSQLENWK